MQALLCKVGAKRILPAKHRSCACISAWHWHGVAESNEGGAPRRAHVLGLPYSIVPYGTRFPGRGRAIIRGKLCTVDVQMLLFIDGS